MSTQLRVGGTAPPYFHGSVAATLNKNGSFEARFHLTGGGVVVVTVVALLNDSFVGTRDGNDVLIPFGGFSMMEIL